MTARRYGLRVDEWVDERKDPVKSTVAASRMLQDLYKKYSSWDLAIAAYNAGERRINRITTRSGCNEFWELAGSGNFNIETRYPFLDRDLVQEFLWLTAELKNKHYKAPLREYLIRNKTLPRSIKWM